MDSSRLKNEGWLYGLAFLFALALRIIALGAASLTDSEATLALQALHIAQGKSVLLAPQPAYILFTSPFFSIIEATNFMARILPALVGSALVFVPFLFRGKIGSRPALILAIFFSFDPGLVALSRQSSGTILAVTFLLFAWGMWMDRRMIPTGIFLGLALLSGPSIWSGILILALTSVFVRTILPKPAVDQEYLTAESDSQVEKDELHGPVPSEAETVQPVPRNLLFSLLVTLILGGTLFFTVPNGLSALLASIPVYFTGWVSDPANTAGRTLFAFIAYEIFGISVATFSLIRGFRTNSKRIIRLSVWLGVALLLTIFYRQTAELAWAIIPLLALAAMEFSRAFDTYREEYVEVGVVALAIFLLLVYLWFNISGFALNPAPVPATVPILGVVQNPRVFVIYGSAGILFVSIALVAFGWSARTARLGSVWAFTIFFGLYSLAAAWGASGMRDPGGVELWLPDSRPMQADLLRQSMDQVSEYSVGQIASQSVTIFGISSPALEWLLQDYDVEVVPSLDRQVAPPIVITPLMNDLALPSAYRGQDFVWRRPPTWDLAKASDWVNWLVFRKLPTQSESIILWARNDLFPDARGSNP